MCGGSLVTGWKGEVFEFKGSKCTVIKLSNQINNRKAFVIVEFRRVDMRRHGRCDAHGRDLKSKSKRTETFRAEEKVRATRRCCALVR